MENKHHITDNRPLIREQMSMYIQAGFISTQKYLPQKYFYDDTGSSLFEEMMDRPAYYLSRLEYELLQGTCQYLRENLKDGEPLTIIDLGCGNAYKTKRIIREGLDHTDFQYMPVDISLGAVSATRSAIEALYPNRVVEPLNNNFEEALPYIKEIKGKKLVLFLGASIGAFYWKDAIDFLKDLHENLSKDDMLLLGFDLIKSPEVIYEAYRSGVTKNMLLRINRELGGNFDIDLFEYFYSYCPVSYIGTHYLLSRIKQQVPIDDLDMVVKLDKWEAINCGISRKYTPFQVNKLSVQTGFRTAHTIHDKNKGFIIELWEKE